MKLYHGTKAGDIDVLRPSGGSLFLGGSIPYSLFYIWDAAHNLSERKWVTAWLKDGVAYYEEQFDGQLQRFYGGVDGWVYTVKSDDVEAVPDRENMWRTTAELPVADATYIADVYESLMRHEASGELKIVRMPDERRRELHERIAQELREKEHSASEINFYKTFFPEAWHLAHQSNTLM